MKAKLLNFFTILFLTVFCLIFFATAQTKSTTTLDKNRSAETSVKFRQKFSGIASAIDGDSIKIGSKEIRLFGLDAPEYNQKCFDEKNEAYDCGLVSSEFLRKLVDGKKLACFYSSKDVYSRFLARCFIGKISINEEIVKNGMAVVYDLNEADEKMLELEAQAKEHKLGLWRGPFQLPKDYRKRYSE